MTEAVPWCTVPTSNKYPNGMIVAVAKPMRTSVNTSRVPLVNAKCTNTNAPEKKYSNHLCHVHVHNHAHTSVHRAVQGMGET